MRWAYYNEIDPQIAAWLRELITRGLIADGEVDERDIRTVQPADVQGFAQCHFFAGIGGWSAALRLAGWPDDEPVWTGSCPCQKFSSATRGRGVAEDEWPALFRLVESVRPSVLFGEQVASARAWFDRLCDDVENVGYSVLEAVLPACSVGLDHVRERIYFACDADSHGQSSVRLDAEVAMLQRDRCDAGGVVSTDGLPGRMAIFRGFGNAIVPQVAQAFIEAYCEVMHGAALDV